VGRVTSVSLSWVQVRGLTGSGEDLEGGGVREDVGTEDLTGWAVKVV
jgi:hypothetical protein